MILIPLLGWAMVSTSSYGLPTMIFSLFEWPHMPFLVNLDNKLDMITERLLNPDKGVAARVNRNTAMRKVLVKAMWMIYAITLGALIKLFTE